MAIDPRQPVIVGVGEAVCRPGEGPSAAPPALTAAAVREALQDARAGDNLLKRVGAVATAPSVAWPDGDQARAVADQLGLNGVATLRSSLQGGNGPQLLVNVLAERIQAGRLDAAIVCGAEALRTVADLARRGETPGWPTANPERRPGEAVEGEHDANTEGEAAVGMIAPIMAYPLIENALRASAGRSQREQLELVARIWSRFSEVAAAQPAAWSREPRSPEQIAAASPDNRRVTLPYLKQMNANIQVDQAAAVVLCSAGTARELGVPADRWVFPHAGARATDEWFLSERAELHRSPAIRAAGRAVLGHAGATPDDLGPVDLYSCFPSAVQLAALELGLPVDDPGRSLTCTGGLTFFGGPGNNYATHGIAAVARDLREAPAGTLGLSTAVGWYATKHALGLYGNAPPERPYAALEPEVEPARRDVAPPADMEATAETATILFHKDGTPSHAILFALCDDGRRALGNSGDPDVLAAVEGDDFLGSRVALRSDRSFEPA